MLDMDETEAPPVLGGRRGVGVALIALVLVAVAAVAGGKVLLSRFGGPAPDYDGPGTGSVSVQVPKGASATRIGTILAERQVVKSAGAFRDAARKDARSLSIQPGWYALKLHMEAKLALDLLLDPKARIRSRFTIPEGTTLAATLERISKSVDKMPLASLQEAAANPAALGLPDWAGGKLEGLLFPATYDVEPGTSAVEVLTMMVDRFEVAAAAAELEERAAALKLTPYQLLTVASLIEGETPKEAERAKVARVVYNRLAKGMRLEFDSTVKYAWGLRGVRKTRLLHRDLEIDSPYNTYRRTGLPPGPISSPGDAALEGAASPVAGPWLYFVVTDKDGNSEFTDSYDEFLRFKAKYRRDVLGEG